MTHQPCYSQVYEPYLLPSGTALLTASTQLGIVGRSYPDTGQRIVNPLSPFYLTGVHSIGKTLRGYLTAFSSAMAVGNPDMDTPTRVTSIAMGPISSPNGVAVLWGYFSGEIALTTALAVMKDGCSNAIASC